MLELRPNCESCDCDLPPDSTDAMICSFERTFCRQCADEVFDGSCPNCGGKFEARPVPPLSLLGDYPPSAKRVMRN